jgi:ribosomal protein L32
MVMGMPNPIVSCPDCGDLHRSARHSRRCTPCTNKLIEKRRAEATAKEVPANKAHLALLRQTQQRF